MKRSLRCRFGRGQKTGWFYDHHTNRARFASLCAGKRVLDVFSYLGAWGIAALTHGASALTCVESSAFASAEIERNYDRNRSSISTGELTLINADAFDALKELKATQQRFDVVVVDPPAFAKRRKDKEAGILAYQRINELAMHCLAKEGYLMACSCSMHVSDDEYLALLQRAAYKARRDVQVIAVGGQGADHPRHVMLPETNYLTMILLRVM